MNTPEPEPLTWTTVQRKVSDLIPYEHNPRILTEEKKQVLLESMQKFNLVEIPVINADNTLIAGHQRLKIMFVLGRGEETIDVRHPNRMLTELELKEYNIRSNVQIGMWDRDILEEVFSDIDLGALGLDLNDIPMPGSDPASLKPEEEQDFDLEQELESITVPVTVEGDVYEFVSTFKNLTHRVVCGSSTDAGSIAVLMDGVQADVVVTDPPYNVDYQGKTKEKLKIENDRMDNSSFFQFLLDFYSCTFDIMKAGAPIYVFHADTEGANFRNALKDAGLKLSQTLVWVKQSMVLGRQDYHWKHEPILYGWREGAAHKWYGDRCQTTVLLFDRPSRNEDHPTMKPVEILCYLLEQSSAAGDIVFDGFLGSGSIIIASEKLLRQAYGQELDPKYVDVEVRRWVRYMRDNGLPFIIRKNGIELSHEELAEYEQQLAA